MIVLTVQQNGKTRLQELKQPAWDPLCSRRQLFCRDFCNLPQYINTFLLFFLVEFSHTCQLMQDISKNRYCFADFTNSNAEHKYYNSFSGPHIFGLFANILLVYYYLKVPDYAIAENLAVRSLILFLFFCSPLCVSNAHYGINCTIHTSCCDAKLSTFFSLSIVQFCNQLPVETGLGLDLAGVSEMSVLALIRHPSLTWTPWCWSLVVCTVVSSADLGRQSNTLSRVLGC